MPQSTSTLRKAAGTIIRHSRYKYLHKLIVECHDLTHLMGEPNCLGIQGLAGVGKTTLITDYVKKFPRKIVGDKTLIPVLLVSAPKPVTVKMMSTEMLRSIGDPLAEKGDQDSKNNRLVNYIGNDCETELVIIDEFQHLIQSGTDKVLADVSDWLKHLIKATNVPFLVVGQQGQIELILNSNPQLKRLFDVVTLDPFTFDTENPETIQEFGDFLVQFERKLELELPWRSDDDIDLVYRMHYATDGIVAYVRKLMFTTAKMAIDKNADQLEMRFLSTVFEEKFKKKLEKEHNPFAKKWVNGFKPPLRIS